MGKKTRRSRAKVSAAPSSSTGLSPSQGQQAGACDDPLVPIKQLIKICEDTNAPIERNFSRHIHSISSCNGSGVFTIASLFVVRLSNSPGSEDGAFISNLCIRVHDNLRNTCYVPVSSLKGSPDLCAKFCGEDIGRNLPAEAYYNKYLDDMRNRMALGFQRAPYKRCAILVSECLHRMRENNKMLANKEEKILTRLFALDTQEGNDTDTISPPTPSPAPSVNELWITLNRPEYLNLNAIDDLVDGRFIPEFNTEGFQVQVPELTKPLFNQSLECITCDNYKRKRWIGILQYMSIYHGLAREEEVASWLLWERNSLTVHPLDHPETISAMKRNVVLQLLVCKSFQCGTFRLPYPPTPGEWGRAIWLYQRYKVNLEYYGSLPPGYRSIVTAKIAEDTGMHDSNIASAEGPAVNITRAIKALSSTKSSCAVCGARRAQDGSKLSQCSKCYSVSYCCHEHQKMHWKNGHKQECTPPDLPDNYFWST